MIRLLIAVCCFVMAFGKASMGKSSKYPDVLLHRYQALKLDIDSTSRTGNNFNMDFSFAVTDLNCVGKIDKQVHRMPLRALDVQRITELAI